MRKKLFKILIFKILLSTIFFSYNANSQDILFKINNNLEKNVRIGASTQIVGFDTPGAHSILEWNSDTIDIGFDVKYNISDKIFTQLEYSYGKIKGGSSIDDDIQNGGGVYSVHGVDGRSNDYKLNIGYNVYNYSILKLFATGGIFYKDIKVTSTDGFDTDGNVFDGYGSQTNSKYYGAMIGTNLQFNNQKNKSSLQFDLLIPVKYHGDQIWYGRDPDLYWKLRNNKNIHGDWGIRLRADFGYKLDSNLFNYIKFYTYYERIQFNGLKESEPDWSVKGGSPGSVIEGSADYKSYGAGIALEF